MKKTVPFFKMSGSGNDFIIIDNRTAAIQHIHLTAFIPSVCRRRMSVGADGVILVEDSETADFKWHFFNSDGSRAEMCGNGARCAARFAYLNQIAGSSMSFETDAGRVHAEIKYDRVKIKMTDPVDMMLDYSIPLAHGDQIISSINTGVPHVVLETEAVETVDVGLKGREIRYHKEFEPQGTNVNFVTPMAQDLIVIRTYERGVEDETLACGTGAVAAALISAAKYNKPSPLHMKTRSSSILTIHFTRADEGFSEVYLEGDARVIYAGEIWEDAWVE